MTELDPIFAVSFEYARRFIRAEAEDLGLELPPIEVLPDEPVVLHFNPWREDRWITDGTTRFALINHKVIVRNASYLARVLANTSLISAHRERYVIDSLRITFDCDPEDVMRRLRIYRDFQR
jgi:hypothetical protein